jgi:hypothetical protein
MKRNRALTKMPLVAFLSKCNHLLNLNKIVPNALKSQIWQSGWDIMAFYDEE